MSICHHPSEELLLDYTTGALGEAWSIAVATHLALCPDCRNTIGLLEGIGGSLMGSIQPAALDDGGFDALLARLEKATDVTAGPPPLPRPAKGKPVLPEPLRSYLGCDIDTVPWKRLGRGAYQCIIPTGDKGATARLLRIPAGRPVPEHSHGGLELTLVLRGAFSDETGVYGRGDFQEADQEVLHQPRAAPGEDCVCLAITDAPLRFRSLAARLVQPLLNI